MKIQDIVDDLGQFDTMCGEQKMGLLAASRILSENKIGALPVVDDDYNLVGIISERDIVRSIAEQPETFFTDTVESAMTTQLITCSPEDPALDVFNKLKANRIRHVPVVDAGGLTVILSIRDFDDIRVPA